MAQTPLMRADEIVNGFNGVTERKYWRASIAGTRTSAEVHFNSRATMVRISYRVVSDDFIVTFSKTGAAFGDYMASAYRALSQVLASLKAAGLPFSALVEESDAELRLAYDPKSRNCIVYIARHGDAWLDTQPTPFKVPERNNSEISLSGLDGL